MEASVLYRAKPAPYLNMLREALRIKHSALLAEVAAGSKDGHGTDLSERVAALRASVKEATIARIVISERLTHKILVVSIHALAAEITANTKLTALCTEVAATLQKLETK